jgi:hypothetical protein
VRAARLGDGGEAIQPVANHGAGRIERGLGKGLALDAPKPWTRRNLMPTGLPSTVVATAAMNGILPADPRPRWPPERLPPRSASSISMRPVSGFSAWRSSLALQPDLEQLVLQRPGRGLPHAQPARQLQRRDPALALGEVVQGLDPPAQR